MPSLSITPVACFGEILWDVLPGGKRLGGAPFNVAYHLGQLGVPVRMISSIGNDADGAAIRDLLAEKQVSPDFLQTAAAKPTSMVYATESAAHEMQYEIVEDVAWDEIVVTPENSKLVAEAPFFVFGSLSARAPVSRNTLMTLLEQAECAVFDINLRQPFYSPALITALLEKTSILKINEGELDILSDWLGYSGDTLHKLNAIAGRFSLGEILVTRGANGALVYKEGNHWSCDGIATTVADTVGSGDAFLAGYLFAWLSRSPMEQRIQVANQLAAWVTRSYGACPPYDAAISTLIHQLIIKKPALQ
jgi:fructokinase